MQFPLICESFSSKQDKLLLLSADTRRGGCQGPSPPRAALLCIQQRLRSRNGISVKNVKISEDPSLRVVCFPPPLSLITHIRVRVLRVLVFTSNQNWLPRSLCSVINQSERFIQRFWLRVRRGPMQPRACTCTYIAVDSSSNIIPHVLHCVSAIVPVDDDV